MKASKYVLDPLSAPEPSDETGPGTHFESTFAPAKEEKKQPQATVEEVAAYPSPPDSASPHRTRFSDLVERQNTNNDRPSTEIPTSSKRTSLDGTGRRRGSSLAERYEGDESHRPLDIIRRESKRAHRSPHLRKERHHGLDTIDKLDSVGDSFHHEGPYDAVSWARNSSSRGAPVAALAGSNAEALKATPQAFVHNSLKHHRPLDGFAQVPAGVPDRLTGQVLDYEEGTDMQRDDDKNHLNHWQGVVSTDGAPTVAFNANMRRNILQKTARAKANRHTPLKRISKPASTEDTFLRVGLNCKNSHGVLRKLAPRVETEHQAVRAQPLEMNRAMPNGKAV